MKPGSFDPATSREVVGDGFARQIEAKARSDADAGTYDPPAMREGLSYWDRAQDAMRQSIYHDQFRRRTERLARKAAAATEH